MKALNNYEHLWQEAFDNAEFAPSDKVWSGVSRSLDQGSRANGWLPILLVAATVTLAMAFPTTIGDSVLQLKDVYGPKHGYINHESSSVTDFTADSDQTVNKQEQTVVTIHAQKSLSSPQIHMTRLTVIDDSKPSIENYDISVAKVKMGDLSISPGTIELPYYITGLNYALPNKSFKRSDLIAFQIGGGSGKSGESYGGLSFTSANESLASDISALNTDILTGESDRRLFLVGVGLELPVAKRSAIQLSVNYLNSSTDGTSNQLLLSSNRMSPLAYNDVFGEGLVTIQETYDYVVQDHFVSFPVVYKYAFLQRDFIIRAGVGTGLDWLLRHQINSSDYGNHGYKAADVGISPLWISLIGNVEFGYWLAPNYLMSLEAGYNASYGLYGNAINYDNNRGGYSVGLKINYRLK